MEMNYDTITRERTGRAAIITMRRPDVMNALNTQMRAEITHAIGTAGKEARVVVLTGRGAPSARARTWATGRMWRTSTSNARCATNTSRC
jgi:enoyl-CoA hydratase/carnithine racemase